jgi:hypothetical protein
MRHSVLGPDKDAAVVQRYTNIQEKMKRNYREAMDNPRHFEKVDWFVDYWNRSLPDRTNIFRVYGPD